MTERTTVAIVGGGPVGLFLAAELGVRGIETVVLADALGPSMHPKANTHTARSMEIYRRHRISAVLRERGLAKGHRTDVAYYTRLRGYELHRVPLPTPAEAQAETREAGTRWPTPEPQFRASQIVLEPVLLERARSFPSVEVRYRHRVTGLEQRPGEVELTVTNDDRALAVRARYVVGCDGGRSTVRSAIGAQLGGVGGLALDFMGGRMEATYFRAPGLQRRLRHPYAWQNWILLPHLRALLVTLDAENDLYLLHDQLPPEPQPRRPFEDVLTEVVGEPIASEVISYADWRAGISLVADRFRVQDVFLAGDAAHLFTPTGGFGVNTGIEDAFNLGWKLAAVIHGWAPDALLDTYAAERRPIAERNTAYALTLARRNGECPVDGRIEDDGPAGAAARERAREHLEQYARWEFDTPGIQLGVSYRGSAIVLDDGSDIVPDRPTEYVPNAAPGSRLPHVWLSGGDALFDRLGPEFTLIALDPTPDAWLAAAAVHGVPLAIVELPHEPELRRLVAAPFVLVRPDQHIAWRGTAEDDPRTVLDVVAGLRLDRSLETA